MVFQFSKTSSWQNNWYFFVFSIAINFSVKKKKEKEKQDYKFPFSLLGRTVSPSWVRASLPREKLNASLHVSDVVWIQAPLSLWLEEPSSWGSGVAGRAEPCPKERWKGSAYLGLKKGEWLDLWLFSAPPGLGKEMISEMGVGDGPLPLAVAWR